MRLKIAAPLAGCAVSFSRALPSVMPVEQIYHVDVGRSTIHVAIYRVYASFRFRFKVTISKLGLIIGLCSGVDQIKNGSDRFGLERTESTVRLWRKDSKSSDVSRPQN